MDEQKKEKYLKIFRAEAEELLKKIRESLFVIEGHPEDKNTINTILRSAHTLKGSARMVGLEEIGKLAHRMEDLLKAVEAGSQPITGPVVSLLFKASDLIDKMMSLSPQVDKNQVDALMENLTEAAEGKELSKPAAGPAFKVEEIKEEKIVPKETLRVEASRLDKMINFSSQLVLDRIRFESNLYKFKNITEKLEEILKTHQETLRGDSGTIYKKLSALSRQFREFFQQHFEDVVELEHDVQETHFQALFLRMFPISTLFEEFPFYLRELTQELGKKIELKLEGGDSELDKRVLEELRGPMAHLLRNACDHGIEPPEERKTQGKPEAGQVKIRAYPKGNQIVIEISDDGKGLDYEQIRARALELGYFDEQGASAWGENELLQLIFQPGFSTSKIVTEVSGRGVGMDVVKTALEKLGGDITIDTSKGRGTTIRLQVPFTLGMLRCVLAMVAGTIYAFPVNSLDGTMRVQIDQIQSDRGKPLIPYQQEMIPIYYLGDLFGYDNPLGWPRQEGFLAVLILSHSQQRIAIVVDKILREDDLVTKSFSYPLAGQLKFVSGSTLLRAGEVGLILNIFEIFEEARKIQIKAPTTVSPAKERRKARVMVVDDSLTARIVQRNLLEQAGYEVDLAESAMEALGKIANNDYDIFLVDIEMPEMDGFELTKRIKAEPKTKRTPVMIVSTRSTDEDKRKGIEAGAQGYIVKSKLDPLEFIKMIKHLIGE